MDYKGYIDCDLTEEQVIKFYSGGRDEVLAFFPRIENCYYLIHNPQGEVIEKLCYQKGAYRKVEYKKIENQYTKPLKPRNVHQELAFDLLTDKSTKVKLLRGVYGSGKDLIMLNQALALIEKGVYKKIIFIRPNVTAAGVPEIGYLKGTAEEKLAWTLGPFYDKVGGEEGVQQMIENDTLENVPLLFIRGRSFDNSIVYVTEGQNITSEIAKLIISRIGENSELWINADNHQTDRAIYEKDNGIARMVDKLSGNELFGYVYLPKTERGAVADLANLLD